MWFSVVSAPTRLAVNRSVPVPLIVPPMTKALPSWRQAWCPPTGASRPPLTPLDDDSVRDDPLTRPDDDQVALEERLGGDRHPLPVTDDGGRRRPQVHQLADGGGAPPPDHVLHVPAEEDEGHDEGGDLEVDVPPPDLHRQQLGPEHHDHAVAVRDGRAHGDQQVHVHRARRD